MNLNINEIRTVTGRDQLRPDVSKELDETRQLRESVREKPANVDGAARLPYSSRPAFLGTRWK
jgi:hypothetical protein